MEGQTNHETPPMRTSSNFLLSMSVLILNWGDLDDNGVGEGGLVVRFMDKPLH